VNSFLRWLYYEHFKAYIQMSSLTASYVFFLDFALPSQEVLFLKAFFQVVAYKQSEFTNRRVGST